MLQMTQNNLNYLGCGSEESTDLPSHKSLPNYSVTLNDNCSEQKKIFSITKTRNRYKPAKLIDSTGVQTSSDNSNISVIENDQLINKLFLLRKKYSASLISMKVVL